MKKNFLGLFLFVSFINASWAIDCSKDFSGGYKAKSIQFIFDSALADTSPSQEYADQEVIMFHFDFKKSENNTYQFVLDHMTKHGEMVLAYSSVDYKNNYFKWLENLEKDQLSIAQDGQECKVQGRGGKTIAKIDPNGIFYTWKIVKGVKVYDHLFGK